MNPHLSTTQHYRNHTQSCTDLSTPSTCTQPSQFCQILGYKPAPIFKCSFTTLLNLPFDKHTNRVPLQFKNNAVVLVPKKRQIQEDLDEISPVDEDRSMTLGEGDDDATFELASCSSTKVVIMEPLLLQMMPLRKSRTDTRLNKRQLYQEHKKNVRLMISYSFLICGLLVISFFTLYLR